MIGSKPTTAIVQQAEESERQLVERAIASLSISNWEVGECASKWTERYARGRTDEQFGVLVDLPGSQVQKRRQVWETFADVRDDYPSLKWSHFYAAITWDDAAECLAWAEENRSTVRGMIEWRRTFDSSTESINEHFNDPEIPESSPTYGNIDDGMQSEGQAIGHESAAREPHVADVDPHQKPPSTVVSTPRDFEDDDSSPAVSVSKTVDVSDVVAVLSKAIDAWSSHGVEESDRLSLASRLRQLADEIEGV